MSLAEITVHEEECRRLLAEAGDGEVPAQRPERDAA
jgi:hypothetical protein